MRGPNGENPMHHLCSDKGCWRHRFCPNVEDFAKAFPEKNFALSDADYWAERNGCLLFIDFKQDGKGVPEAHWLAFTRLSLWPRAVFWIVWHEPGEPNNFLRIRVIQNGRGTKDVATERGDLIRRMTAWFVWADRQAPLVGTLVEPAAAAASPAESAPVEPAVAMPTDPGELYARGLIPLEVYLSGVHH